MVCVSQNALHWTISCSLHNLLDVIILGLRPRKCIQEKFDNVTVLMSDQNVTHRLLQADRQVNHRHVGGGNTEGHAGQLAVNKCLGKSDSAH